MRSSDWSSDVCSSDLTCRFRCPCCRARRTGKQGFTFILLEVLDQAIEAVRSRFDELPSAELGAFVDEAVSARSEVRRAGKECVGTYRSRRSQYHYKTNKHTSERLPTKLRKKNK